MSDAVGNCLFTYLKHESVLEALDLENLPGDLKDERETISAFEDRASVQAADLLEDMVEVVESDGFLKGFRGQRKKAQRRTLERYWYTEGHFLRSRERTGRISWSLILGSLRQKGPSVVLVVAPVEPMSPAPIDKFAAAVARDVGLESANAKDCFLVKQGIDFGVAIAAVALEASLKRHRVAEELRRQADTFARLHRQGFEEALASAEE